MYNVLQVYRILCDPIFITYIQKEKFNPTSPPPSFSCIPLNLCPEHIPLDIPSYSVNINT